MKKLEIIIRPEKLEELKMAVEMEGATGMTLTTVMGYGNQKGSKELYRGTEVQINLVHKLKAEIIIKDELLEDLIRQVKLRVATGEVGDGKIFVYAVEDAVRIRTGERGEMAV